MAYSFDTSIRPFVTVKSTGVAERADLDYFIEELERDFGVFQNYVLILDATAAKGMSFANRHYLGQRITRFNAETPSKLALGTVIIVQSITVRGIIKALNWTAPPPTPLAIVKNLDEAYEWARRTVEESQPNSRRTLSQAFRSP